MKLKAVSAAVLLASTSFAVHAQEAPARQAEIQIKSTQQTTEDTTEITLPANSEVVLRMAEELTTKGGRAKVGQTFRLTVAYDVRVNGVTVIPMGTPAIGEVTMKTGRAVFGKSGKMDIELRSINLDGQRVEITGSYRQQGEGDTLAAVGAVVLAAPLLVITGKSAVIPRGRELVAHTVSPLTVPVS